MQKTIHELAKSYHEDLIKVRRHLHQNPELSFQEKETGRYIAAQLKKMEIKHEHGCAQNGVVAIIKGQKKNKNIIALRGDIDALPIQETSEVSYRSQRPGIMHACGHDVHTTSLLGTARILQNMKSQFGGTIKLIFQPGEEQLPGGASIMIKEGVLKNPAPQKIFGQHVHPPLAVGKVGFCPGMYMASADELFLKVKGKGGHGALPQNCVDPILITAHLITALQQVVSRMSDPTIPSVLTFGKIASNGGATNIITDEVNLMGTFRTMNEKWRKEAHRRLKKLVTNLAKSMGGSAELEIKVGYPFLDNNIPMTLQAKDHAIEYLGKQNVVDLPIRMTSEDFAWYSQEIPGCFYRLGTGNIKRGIVSPVHTSTFDVDEKSLEVGSGLMAWLAIRALEN